MEAALFSILDGLKSNATHVSFFCREYWGTSASRAQLSLERLGWGERLKPQVQQACVLESLGLGVASHLCSGTMQDVSLVVRSRLRNLLYYLHENCLVLLDLVCQRWLAEGSVPAAVEAVAAGRRRSPQVLNFDILIRVKRYRQLRRDEHVVVLRQHNDMIASVVRQLCRGAASKRQPLAGSGAAPSSSRGPGTARADRGFAATTGGRGSARGPAPAAGGQPASALCAANEILNARIPLDRQRAGVIRRKMLQQLRFRPLLNVNGADPDCPWPTQDPYTRYGAEHFASDGPIIWYEPLPPMLTLLEVNPTLPPAPSTDVYTLVLDLDETLVHYFERDGMGTYGIRPGMHEFLHRMSCLGYELVIFTAATQDYADWVIDQVDTGRLVHHRLYRQHALPWGPLFAKDLSRLGRDLDRTLIIDNVQENFMLQPNNGIFIVPWYDDPNDTALFSLTPLLDELIKTRARVPELLEKYRDQIPAWAGFGQDLQFVDEVSYEPYQAQVDVPPPYEAAAFHDEAPHFQPAQFGVQAATAQPAQLGVQAAGMQLPQQHGRWQLLQAPARC